MHRDARRVRYDAERKNAVQEFLASAEGKAKYDKTLAIW